MSTKLLAAIAMVGLQGVPAIDAVPNSASIRKLGR